MRSLAAALCFALVLGVGGCQWGQEEREAELAGPLLGRKIESLSLQSIDGERYSLEALEDKSAVVLAWTSLGCPMSRIYLPRLRRLAADFEGQGVQFFLINSASQDSLRAIHESAREEELGFPRVRDRGAVLAHHLGVKRTTAVLVLDRQRSVVYHGAVDDQYGYRKQAEDDGLPNSVNSVATYRRDEASEHYLRDAIRQVLAGESVQTAETDPLGCALGLNWTAEAYAETFELNFHEDIEGLLQENCQGCHRKGGSAPFALTDYRNVVGWAEMIREVVSEGRMPPWNADPTIGTFKNDRRLSEEEISRVTRWVDLGLSRGDPKKAPKAMLWPEGWEIGEPDTVLTIPEFTVAAEGRVPYRYVTVAANLEEDRWVEAAQIKSTESEVVHHVLVFLKEGRGGRNREDRPWSPRWNLNTLFGHLPKRKKGEYLFRTAKYVNDLWQNTGGGLFGYFISSTPGDLPMIFPEGQARFLPAGASLTFQIHYQPLGKEVRSVTTLGLKFRDEPPGEVREVWGATSVTFKIPPGVEDHLETAKHRFQRGGKLFSLKPHMHVRGKSARYILEHLDGKMETLLNVPNYDFDWQHTYEFAEPKRVEKGETLHVQVTFDNSKANPYNPDPEKFVYFGLQADEEMLIGYFEAIWDDSLSGDAGGR